MDPCRAPSPPVSLSRVRAETIHHGRALAPPDRTGYGSGVTFRLERPTGRPAPLVVEVPHAGTRIPEDAVATLRADARDVARDADLFVDELFADAPAHGAVLLAATTSRYVVDLNR